MFSIVLSISANVIFFSLSLSFLCFLLSERTSGVSPVIFVLRHSDTWLSHTNTHQDVFISSEIFWLPVILEFCGRFAHKRCLSIAWIQHHVYHVSNKIYFLCVYEPRKHLEIYFLKCLMPVSDGDSLNRTNHTAALCTIMCRKAKTMFFFVMRKYTYNFNNFI